MRLEKQRVNFRWYFFAALVVSVIFSVIVVDITTAAPPPNTMNFQGRLTTPSGSVVTDGLYNMQFRVFSSASGGTALWSETRQAASRVQVTNGLFSAQLGEVTPLSASMFSAADLYFEITMATPATANCATAGCAAWESPMTPRSKLATSAYAFNAASLNGQTAGDFAAATGGSGYIQNQSAVAQAASFNINGTGRVGGAFTAAGTSTFTGAMTANNTAAFRSSSTTAFRIQSAGGAATLLTADTTNNVIQIGSATADATAVRFVLDSSNSASDPAGINGAMYYSTATNTRRCYENNAWRDCDIAKGVPVVQTANYTAKNRDFVLADTSAGAFTVTLPAPRAGAMVSVKKISGGGNVTVSAGGGVLIDNLTADVISQQWLSQDYFSDGTKWYRV